MRASRLPDLYMLTYSHVMANQMIYKKDSDAQLWEDAKRLAKDSGRSLSDVVAAALRVYVDGREQARRPAPRTSGPLPAPVADPFAAKD